MKKYVTDKIAPISDSTTAIQIAKADGTTPILTIDTENEKLLAKSDYIPTADAHLATKKYVDDSLNISVLAITTSGGSGTN